MCKSANDKPSKEYVWIVNNVIVNKQQRSEYNQLCVKILAKEIGAKMCKIIRKNVQNYTNKYMLWNYKMAS